MHSPMTSLYDVFWGTEERPVNLDWAIAEASEDQQGVKKGIKAEAVGVEGWHSWQRQQMSKGMELGSPGGEKRF